MTTKNRPTADNTDSLDHDDEDEDDTTRFGGMNQDDDEDDEGPTRLEVGIEHQLIGKAPHEAAFILIRALYQKADFMELLAEKGQHIVTIDQTCRVVFKQDQFKISRRDVNLQGAPSAAGSYKQFSYEEHFEKYKQQKLSENFREYRDVNNRLLLELGRITLPDLMEYARKECMEAIQHLTEAQTKQLVYPHLYKLFVLLSKYKEQYIPFYSDPS